MLRSPSSLSTTRPTVDFLLEELSTAVPARYALTILLKHLLPELSLLKGLLRLLSHLLLYFHYSSMKSYRFTINMGMSENWSQFLCL